MKKFKDSKPLVKQIDSMITMVNARTNVFQEKEGDKSYTINTFRINSPLPPDDFELYVPQPLRNIAIKFERG